MQETFALIAVMLMFAAALLFPLALKWSVSTPKERRAWLRSLKILK